MRLIITLFIVYCLYYNAIGQSYSVFKLGYQYEPILNDKKLLNVLNTNYNTHPKIDVFTAMQGWQMAYGAFIKSTYFDLNVAWGITCNDNYSQVTQPLDKKLYQMNHISYGVNFGYSVWKTKKVIISPGIGWRRTHFNNQLYGYDKSNSSTDGTSWLHTYTFNQRKTSSFDYNHANVFIDFYVFFEEQEEIYGFSIRPKIALPINGASLSDQDNDKVRLAIYGLDINIFFGEEIDKR